MGNNKRAPRLLLGTGISPSVASSAADVPGYAKGRHYVQGTLFIMANMAICFYWAGFPLNNIYYACGYTQFGTPPAPGPWNCARYSWSWWTVWMLTLNLLLPYLLSAALLNNSVPEYARVLYWLSWFFIWYNLAILAMLLIQWLLMCNSSSSYGNTACNDIRYCCDFFGASATAATWCPNQSPCVPNVNTGDLQRSDEWFQMVIFSGIWTLLSWAFRRITKDLMQKGVFAEE